MLYAERVLLRMYHNSSKAAIMMLAPTIRPNGGEYAVTSFVLRFVSAEVATDAVALTVAACVASVWPVWLLMAVVLLRVVCFLFSLTGIDEGGVDAVNDMVCFPVSIFHVNVLPSGKVISPSSSAPEPAIEVPGVLMLVSISVSTVVTFATCAVSLLVVASVAVTLAVVTALTSVFVAVWLRSLCLREITQDVCVSASASKAMISFFILLCCSLRC